MSRFLAAYDAYVSKLTDAPVEFGRSAGLALLSSIATGRRYLNKGMGIHPNLFFLLMADSSRDRKSTSVDLAIELLREVETDRVGPDDFTGEGLLKIMRTRRPTKKGKVFPPRNKIMLPLPEFGVTLAAQRSYAATMTGILCKLYDGSSFERARAAGPAIKIERPRVSMLGGCAFAMLEQFGEPMDWINGFFARCLFVTAQTRRPVYSSQPVRSQADFDAMLMALRDLRDELENTAQAGSDKMHLLPGAETTFDQLSAMIPVNESDLAATAQRERLMNTTLKLAMLYQIDIDPKQQIGALAMDAACQYALKAWEAFKLVYARSSGSPFGRLLTKIWVALTAAGMAGIERRDLYRSVHCPLEQFLPAAELLTANGIIAKQTLSGSTMYFILDAHRAP